MYNIGTSDFDARMSGIKIETGDEILRPVYQKTVFRNSVLSGCVHFGLFRL
jgi:hypothetical protein